MLKLEKNKGITLLALIITMIILLILAGITISQLSGNGIFDKAKMAKIRNKEKQDEENSVLQDYENNVEKYLNSSRSGQNADYSMEEKVVGTWINNKPIYQITRYYDNNGNGYGQGTNNLENIDSALDIEVLVNCWGIRSPISNTFESYSMVIPETNLYFKRDQGKLVAQISGTTGKWKMYVTMQYTKVDPQNKES